MSTNSCVFCKIVTEEIPAFKIYDDQNFIAILDVFPSHFGQALIIPKEHAGSKFSQIDENLLLEAMAVAKKVAIRIERNLEQVERCQVVVEGLEVDHFHIKLYPALHPRPTAYALTKGGQQADFEELKQLQSVINK